MSFPVIDQGQAQNRKEQFHNREEYVEELKNWLDEARLWHGFCIGFPFYLSLQYNNHNLFKHFNNNILTRDVFRNGNQINESEFVIPPLWKRVVAEILDFFILLFIKMVVTFAVIETFYIVSIENYKFEAFKKNLQDPKIAMQMSLEILTLELLHRFIVCCYEVYWLKGSPCATPGKKYMGLIVIQVNNIEPVIGRNNEVVRVSSYAPLGLQKAIFRAVLKNVFLGVMLPMCFTLFVFRFNRTGYDAVSNSLVVEESQINNH